MEKLPLGLALELRNVVPYKTGSWRTLKPLYIMQTPPCTNNCPINNDIRGFMRTLASQQDYASAWRMITRTNPFPAICGRVCPHTCEDGCNRRDFDSPLAINSCERAVGDFGLEQYLEHHKDVLTTRKDKVAVVGSGPAGLSCAFHLARRGFRVKIFEASRELGGMMRYGIPDYRLPNEVLNREIDSVLRLGIEVECNVKVGVNIDFERLVHDHSAVFLGIGAQKGVSLGVSGEDAQSVMTGIGFLRDINMGRKMEVGRNVVVVGGGNTAMDCARVAKRLGANVSVVYRRTRTEMPAITSEIDEAMEERIMFHYHTNPVKVIMEGNRVVGLLCVQMELKEADSTGRARPVPITGSESVIPANTVIFATGQAVDFEGIEIAKRDNQWIGTDELLMTSTEKVFAGGDAVVGLETVAKAIGQGHQAAIAIEDFIDNRIEGRMSSPPVVYSKDLNTYYFSQKKRLTKEAIAVHERLKSFKEIYPSFDREDILREAGRCFSCGQCFDCGNCLMYCPDNAVKASTIPGKYEFDYDFCKGCGLCVKECPCHFIQLTLEK